MVPAAKYAVALLIALPITYMIVPNDPPKFEPGVFYQVTYVNVLGKQATRVYRLSKSSRLYVKPEDGCYNMMAQHGLVECIIQPGVVEIIEYRTLDSISN